LAFRIRRLRGTVQKRVGWYSGAGAALVCPMENGATGHRTSCEQCGVCWRPLSVTAAGQRPLPMAADPRPWSEVTVPRRRRLGPACDLRTETIQASQGTSSEDPNTTAVRYTGTALVIDEVMTGIASSGSAVRALVWTRSRAASTCTRRAWGRRVTMAG